MSFLSKLFKDEKPVYDDAYWKKRQEERLADKDIVTRYRVCFGHGHYDDFCGVKEIKGYYDKTYRDNSNIKFEEERWIKDVFAFYQIDFDDSLSERIHEPKFVFGTRAAAQRAYNESVDLYITPLQNRIKILQEGMLFGDFLKD